MRRTINIERLSGIMWASVYSVGQNINIVLLGDLNVQLVDDVVMGRCGMYRERFCGWKHYI